MKKIIFLVSLIALASCNERIKPSGNVSYMSHDTGDFTALDIRSAIKATVTMADEPGLVIYADDNLIPEIEVYKENETLVVRVRKNISIKGQATLNVAVKAVRLTEISGSGASCITFPDGISATDLEVELSGASEWRGDVKAGKLDIELHGASQWKGDISARTLDAELHGASGVRTNGSAEKLALGCGDASKFNWDVSDYGFSADVVQAELNGASNVKMRVNSSLDVKADGASRFFYKGTPSVNREDCDYTSVIERQGE